jgi:DtxR family Mn-dependent transcriptional regulator
MTSKSHRMFSQAVEDYVKAAYELQQSGEGVSTSELARLVGHSSAAATKMLKQLVTLGLIDYAPYRGASLTPTGERVALEIIRHHRLIELYLHNQLGYSWDEVHREAEILEHHISEDFEDRLASLLGDPTIDPHGDPIPTRDGVIAPRRGRPLSDSEPGESLVIMRVSDREPEVLRYLAQVGITLGATVDVVEKQPFNGPLTVALSAGTQSIGRELAGYVFVEPRSTVSARTEEAAV